VKLCFLFVDLLWPKPISYRIVVVNSSMLIVERLLFEVSLAVDITSVLVMDFISILIWCFYPLCETILFARKGYTSIFFVGLYMWTKHFVKSDIGVLQAKILYFVLPPLLLLVSLSFSLATEVFGEGGSLDSFLVWVLDRLLGFLLDLGLMFLAALQFYIT
jgi:hypothetical protein